MPGFHAELRPQPQRSEREADAAHRANVRGGVHLLYDAARMTIEPRAERFARVEGIHRGALRMDRDHGVLHLCASDHG
jgi:hypothetical protein